MWSYTNKSGMQKRSHEPVTPPAPWEGENQGRSEQGRKACSGVSGEWDSWFLKTALSSPERRVALPQPPCACSAAFLEDATERNGPLPT